MTGWRARVAHVTRALTAAWLVVAAAGALAHSSSNSYLALEAEDGRPVLRVDIHLRDVDLRIDLDANRDGQVTWGETLAQRDSLIDWQRQGLAARSDSGACTLRPRDLLASERGDGLYLSTAFDLDCPQDRLDGLTLRYTLLFDQDNLHRGLLRLDWAGQQASALFSPDQPEAALLAAAPGAWPVLRRYVVEGVWHIWIGLDHILFLLGLLLLAPLQRERGWVGRWAARPALRPALWDVFTVVTAFTVAHSLTLALALFRVVEPPRAIVETLVALSVVLAALNNLLGWFALDRWRLAFVFGLIHGFGFATALLDLNLPRAQLAIALGGFNLGVEAGQLAIVAAFIPLAWWLRHTRFYRWGVVGIGSLVIAAVGSVWLLQRLGVVA